MHRPDYLVRLQPRGNLGYISQGRAVLATDRDGVIDAGPERGFFVHQTRMISVYRYLVAGRPPYPAAGSNVAEHSWLGYYLAAPQSESWRSGTTAGTGDAAQNGVEVRVSRFVGGGLHEDIDITSFVPEPLSFLFEIEVDADFADRDETIHGRRQQGTLTRRWNTDPAESQLRFDYHAEHDFETQGHRGHAELTRALTLHVRHSSSPPAHDGGRLAFRVDLRPHESWHACLDFVPEVDTAPLLPAYTCRSFLPTDNPHDLQREAFLTDATRFSTRESDTLAPVVIGAIEQARRDLASLRLHDLDTAPDAWTIAAGLPVYLSLFGRDTLTAGWQAALLGPEMMWGTTAALARLQGRRQDHWRDEEPGRMLHEAQTGPLSTLQFDPRQRYYGSETTSGFFPVVLSELWHWTGDKQRLRPLVAPALRALESLDRHSRRPDSGFYEYRTRSVQGLRNQGWKDSGDAIVDEHGRQVEPPIATCEEQAFVYIAKLHLSEVLWWMDEKDEAKRLFHEAGELKKRFGDAFWMDDLGFIALGLDAQGRPIRSITSNPGHCIAAGIVDKELVPRTAGRLLSDDLFSGWGIRTLSSRNPAYNPHSYHRGSVWPVEQGSFAVGFMRYGLHHHLDTLARAQFEAARLFQYFRLPEVFSGHARDADHPFPAPYVHACSPQAWSASAVFCLLQSMLGLYPYAPLNLLLVDPHLPEWLPEITVQRLRVGHSIVTLRFRRQGAKTEYEVLHKEGPLHVVEQPSPWSLTATFAERTVDALSSLATV